MKSFVKFQILDPKLQMKRPKRLIHTYLLILYTYLITDYTSHREKLDEQIVLRTLEILSIGLLFY